MIYDAFMYSGEENILDIRLNILSGIVDKFIILESPKSHSLILKGVDFPSQRKVFSKFEDKIIYFNIDYCSNSNYFYNDFLGRQTIQDILINYCNFSDLDILIHGDLDEIPNANKLKSILDIFPQLDSLFTLMLENRVLCFDLSPGDAVKQFPGSMILNKKALKFPLYQLRQIREKDNFKLIDNIGWHFTYSAGIDKTINKIKYFAHADETKTWIKDKDGLIKCIKNKIAFWDNNTKLNLIEWKSENFPDYIFNNKDKFKENLSFNF